MGRERFVIGFFYWSALAVCLGLAFRYLLPALLPFLVGGLVAMALRPLSTGLHRVTRLPYKGAAFFTAGFFFLAAGGVVWWLGSLLAYQLLGFFSRLPEFYLTIVEPATKALGDRVLAFLSSLSPDVFSHLSRVGGTLGQYTEGLLASASASVLSAIGGAATHLPSLLVALSFSVLSTFFILMDYPLVSGFIKRQLPAPLHRPVRDSLGFLATTGQNVVKAYFLIMAITFAEVSLGLWFLGAGYYLVAGLVVAVLDILPVIGSGAILIPWGVYLLITGSLPMGVGILLIWGVVTVVRAIIEPKILGDKIGLHPLATIVAMYLGMSLGGFAGLILAPITVTLLVYLSRQGHVRLLR